MKEVKKELVVVQVSRGEKMMTEEGKYENRSVSLGIDDRGK